LWIQNKAVIDFRFEAIPINLKKVEKGAGGKKVYHFMGDEIREDEELVGMLQPYVGGVEDALSETIGYARKTFFSKDVRNRENALGNIVADSMLWYTRKLGADFAIQNGGGIRADLREGPIRMKSIHEILPFANCVVVLTVRGRDVQRLFDYIATIQPGRGAFPQISEGLSLTINRLSEKCEDILINGIPFDPDRTYKIVTNSYLAGGGDGYKMFLNSVGRYDTSMSQRDVFIEYIKYLGSNIKPKETGRIRIISRHGVSMPLKLAA
jgi:5'-nucleotidase/UDP-sugar diphosphatase